MLAALLAVTRKDLDDTVRDPLLLALSMMVPLVFVAVFALVIHTSATNPIAVAANGDGEHTQRLVEVLHEIGTEDGPYFDVTTTDPDQARIDFGRGRVPGILHLPSDLDRRLDAGRDARVTLEVFNLDSDVVKNLELRVSHAIAALDDGSGGDIATTFAETSVLPAEIPMQRYVATALLVFAVIYLAMLNTGMVVAGEWEQRTAKPVVLSPLGFGPFIAGKWLTALVLTVGGLTVVAAVLVLGLGYPVARLGAVGVLHLTVLFGFGAALGALLGVTLKNAILLVPASAVIGVAHLLLAGFESYVRGFAHDGALRLLWWVGARWPVSAMTDAMRWRVEGYAGADAAAGPSLTMAAVAAVLTALAVGHLRRHLTFAQGM